MSKTLYIPCASEKNAQDFLRVGRVQSLIEIVGLDKRDLIPSDAARLGYHLIELAEEAGWRNPESDDGK
jgi:hypothetical protein